MLKYALIILVGLSLRLAAEEIQVVSLDSANRLVYQPFTTAGDRLPDFSFCGYRGGGVALPTVPSVAEFAPTGGDDAASLQAAIDAIAQLPLTASGFRGALRLKRGRYQIGTPISIRESGIVIRGEGADDLGTVLIATFKKQGSLFTIGRGDASSAHESVTTSDEASVPILDAYVPVGATSVQVDPSPFRVGDAIELVRPGTAEWIHDLGMDRLPMSARAKTVSWQPEDFTFVFERTVTEVSPGKLSFDVPLAQSFARRYGGGFIRSAKRARISECGIENLRLVSDYDGSVTSTSYRTIASLPNPLVPYAADEQHGWDGVTFLAARDCWVRNVSSLHFGRAHTNISRLARNITVMDCTAADPVSQIAGARRYTFTLAGSLNLVLRCKSSNGRHDFVTVNQVAGPNAFVDCEATEAWATSEVHFKWAIGTLYDNVKVSGPGAGLFAVNRGNMGTGHGWAGNTTVFYNCEAPVIMVSKPPTGQNFIIGIRGYQPVDARTQDLRIQPQCREEVLGRTGIAQGHGGIQSPTAVMRPRSLYLAQLRDRLGQQAVDAISLPLER